jgi:hypothetical protein
MNIYSRFEVIGFGHFTVVKHIEKKCTQITQREKKRESTLWQKHLDEVQQHQLSAFIVS